LDDDVLTFEAPDSGGFCLALKATTRRCGVQSIGSRYAGGLTSYERGMGRKEIADAVDRTGQRSQEEAGGGGATHTRI
jgi:hypothetical protein